MIYWFIFPLLLSQHYCGLRPHFRSVIIGVVHIPVTSGIVFNWIPNTTTILPNLQYEWFFSHKLILVFIFNQFWWHNFSSSFYSISDISLVFIHFVKIHFFSFSSSIILVLVLKFSKLQVHDEVISSGCGWFSKYKTSSVLFSDN